MTRGAREIVRRLYAEGRWDGIVGLGGSGGSSVITDAMRALPIGVPKVMVSTLASGDTRPYVGAWDIMMMYPVIDIAGLNTLAERILNNAAGAIARMVKAYQPAHPQRGRAVNGATQFGMTTGCVDVARTLPWVFRSTRLKPLQRHLSTPGFHHCSSGTLMTSTAIEMVHLKFACGIRHALGSFHNVTNTPRGALCDWFLAGRTHAILPSPDTVKLRTAF
jgi:Uncharacterised protein family (UPF0261)